MAILTKKMECAQLQNAEVYNDGHIVASSNIFLLALHVHCYQSMDLNIHSIL